MAVGRFVERGLGMLAGIVLVRLLTKDAYGTYMQVTLISQLIVTLLLFGLPQSLLYFLPRVAPEYRRRTFGFIFRVVLGLSVLGGIALILGGSALVRVFNNPMLTSLGPILGVYALLFSLDRTIEPTLVALGQARGAALLAGVSAMVMVIATLTPARMGWGVGGIYAGLILLLVARLTYFGSLIRRLPGGEPPVGKERIALRPLMAFALPMGLSALSLEYNRLLDGVVVSMLFAPSQYATYARGAFELPVVDLIVFPLVNVTLPRLVSLWSASDRPAFRDLWNRLVRMQALFAFPAFVYAGFFAQEVIVTLFSEDYRDSTPFFQIYLLTLPLRVTSCAILFQAVGDTRGLLHSTARSLAFNLVLTPVLCMLLGPVGAAWGYFGSQLFLVSDVLFRVSKATGLGFRELLPWRHLFGLGAVAILIGIGLKPLAALVASPIAKLALTGPLFVLLCVAVLVKAGLVGPEERAVLRRWFNRRTGPPSPEE